jgi:hypothetical protein
MAITACWIDAFFEKAWGSKEQEDDQLGNAFSAAGRTMIGAAALQTKDPVRIARFLALPTPYVSAVLWNLDRNLIWTEEAYSDLAQLIAATHVDEQELTSVLNWAMEQFWEVKQPARIDLVSLWYSISWYIAEERKEEVVEPSVPKVCELMSCIN